MSSPPISPAVSRVLAKLTGLGHHFQPSNGGWMAQCPGHDDSTPSLHINVGADGRALLKCMAGCQQDQVIQHLGMPSADLFLRPDEVAHYAQNGQTQGTDQTGRRPTENLNDSEEITSRLSTGLVDSAVDDPPDETGVSLEAYAAAKHLPPEFLAQLGIQQIYFANKPALRIPYRDAENITQAVQLRLRLHRGAHADGRFIWSKKDTTPLLYGLWALEEMRKWPWILLVEGASDCHCAWWHDLPAAGIPGATSWKEEWARWLDGFEKIYVAVEPDTGGTSLKRVMSASVLRDRVVFVDFSFLSRPGQPVKDLSDLHCTREGEEFQAAFDEALKRGVPWSEQLKQEQQAQIQELYAEIQPLIQHDNLIPELRQVFQRAGYVGDASGPVTNYLSMTSRCLSRPFNLAIIGESSSGKNEMVDQAKALMPSEVIHEIDAGSPLAVVYSDADFAHHVVIYSEADSIPEDGPAGSAIRNLANKNVLKYDVVEKTKSGKFQTRHIVKPGPTVLITTSTRSLATQLGTRMFEIGVNDSPEQTLAIMERQALEYAEDAPNAPDVSAWISLQRWLGLQPAKVVIPFSRVLVQLIRPRLKAPPTRLRRDFRQLETCIATIAFLNQGARARTSRGAIIASLTDYGEAVILLEPVFAGIGTEGVTTAIRETVEAVTPNAQVAMGELAKKLGLSATATKARVYRAIDGGWLVNDEQRKGYPAKLKRGIPLPASGSILPTVKELEEALATRHPPPDDPPPTRPVLSPDDPPPVDTLEPETRLVDLPVDDPLDDQLNAAVPTENGSPSSRLVDAGDTAYPDEGSTFRVPYTVIRGTSELVALLDRWTASPPACLSLDTETMPPAEMRQAYAQEKDALALLEDSIDQYEEGLSRIHGQRTKDATALRKQLKEGLAAKKKERRAEKARVQHHAGICEAACVNPLLAIPRLIQITGPDGAAQIIDTTTCDLAALNEWFAHHPTVTVIGQNLGFDLIILKRMGVLVPQTALQDTMLIGQLLSAGSGESNSLEALAERYCGIILDKTEQTGDWAQELLVPKQLDYAARDTGVLPPVHTALQKHVRQENLEALVDLEMRTLPAMIWMRESGVRIDTKLWLENHQEDCARRQELGQQLADILGVRMTEAPNWRSEPQTQQVIKDRGHELPDVSKETLILHADKDPLFIPWVEYRRVASYVSGYGQRWLDEHLSPYTHRAHADWHQIGADSGRIISLEPQLQNLPRVNDVRYRNAIVAEPGHILIAADYSQIELRLMGLVAEDPVMLETYRSDPSADLHTTTLIRVLGLNPATLSEQELAIARQSSKSINFGFNYGAGWKRFLIEAFVKFGVLFTPAEAREKRRKYFDVYQGVAAYHQQVIELWNTNEGDGQQGWADMETLPPFKRPRKCTHRVTDAINHPIQGSCSDMLKEAMARLYVHRDRVPGMRLLLTAHDEILIEVPEPLVQEGAYLLYEDMLGAGDHLAGYQMPLKVDMKIGYRWGSMEKWKP